MGPLLGGKAEVVPKRVAWGGEIFLEHKGTWSFQIWPTTCVANKVLLERTIHIFTYRL